MFSILIVDAEKRACEFLKKSISENCKEVESINIANDTKGALQLIADKKPPVIFIDIDILRKNKSSFFDLNKPPIYELVITSSTDEGAFLSHQVRALHCIPKPLKQEDVMEVLKRVEGKQKTLLLEKEFIQLQEKYNYETDRNIQIPVRKGDEYFLFNSRELIYFNLENGIIKLHFENNQTESVDSTMQKLMEDLPPGQFYQPGRDTCFRLKAAIGYHKNGEYIKLPGNIRLDVSEGKRSFIKNFYSINKK